MALDLAQLVLQIKDMAERLRVGEGYRRQRLDRAVEALRYHSLKAEDLRKKVEASKTTWLVAGMTGEGLGFGLLPSPPPENFSVMATDGSHIDIDRHHSAGCYLINIGKVSLCYGTKPDAWLNNIPVLHYSEEDLVIGSPDPGHDGQRVEGNILGATRSVQECRALVEMAKGAELGLPTLGLLDGSLVLWDLVAQKYPDFVAKELLDKGLLGCLDDIKALSDFWPFAFGSYISFPRSTEVVNALRVALCPHETADCDRHCRSKNMAERICEEVASVKDADVFLQLLSQGERSAVFISHSSVVDKYYGIHKVCFFYIHVGEEIARVEIPFWMAERKDLLGLAHALILDQCNRGDGYPVALSEAHQKAVVTGADREQFWQLVESALEKEQLPALTSAKNRSKRRPWV